MLVEIDGRIVAPPEPPAAGSPIADVITWLRADAAFRDAVSSAAGRAFAVAFRKAMRRK